MKELKLNKNGNRIIPKEQYHYHRFIDLGNKKQCRCGFVQAIEWSKMKASYDTTLAPDLD